MKIKLFRDLLFFLGKFSILYWLTLILLLQPITAFAFKPHTHLWVAQQILNDVVPDGKVTIEPLGEFDLPAEVVEALRQYPDYFRMGSIGPDAFPDLVGGQMTVHPGVVSGWKTDDWLRYIFRKTELNPNQSLAFLCGYLVHAASDVFSHTYVNTYSGDIFNLSDGEAEAELRHMALEDYIIAHQPPLLDHNGTVLKPESIMRAPAARLRDILILDGEPANQYRKVAATLYLASMYDFWKNQGEAIDKVNALRREIGDKIGAIQGEIDYFQGIISDAIKWLNDIRWCWSVCIPFTDICWDECLDFPDYPEICLAGFIDPSGGLFSAPITTACATIASAQATLAITEVSLEIPRALNDLAFYSVLIPLEAWRGEVEEATKQYIYTSQDVAIELMKHGDPKEKLDRWLCEWAPAFLGVPNEVTLPGCYAKGALNDFKNGVSDVRGWISDRLGLLGWLVDPLQKVDEIVQTAIKPELEKLGVNLVGDLTGEGSLMTSLARLYITKTMDSTALNKEFAQDSSSKGLLEIGDIASRIDADMFLTPEKQFDPQRFYPVHNAIVLSKLALERDLFYLSREIQARAGIQSTMYGAYLYDCPDPMNCEYRDSNILFNAVRSIDGNHQWQEYGIPYPRRLGYLDSRPKEERQYGYPFAEGGFRLWQDCATRNKVFMEIFHGPLAPGIEDPSIFGLPEILQVGDPNRSSLDNPFPLAPDSVRIWRAGDLDGDCDVDIDDLNRLLKYRNKPASVCPRCDLDGDGMITALDSRKLVLLCTRPKCANK